MLAVYTAYIPKHSNVEAIGANIRGFVNSHYRERFPEDQTESDFDKQLNALLIGDSQVAINPFGHAGNNDKSIIISVLSTDPNPSKTALVVVEGLLSNRTLPKPDTTLDAIVSAVSAGFRVCITPVSENAGGVFSLSNSFSVSTANDAASNPMVAAVNAVNQAAGKQVGYSWDLLDDQRKLIVSELNELEEGIVERDIVKTRDAIADVLVTALGCGSVTPIPVEEDFFAVIDSLYSRFDKTPDDAATTLAKHTNAGLKVATRETTLSNGEVRYVCVIVEECTDAKGEVYPKGKFLKAHGYTTPVFKALDETFV